MSRMKELYMNPFTEADRLYNSPLAQELLREYGPPPSPAEGLSLTGKMPWDEDDDGPMPWDEPDPEPVPEPVPQPKVSQAKPILEMEKKGNALRVLSALEIANATYTPPPFVVEGLLPAGLTVFAAPPKTGKSWLCLELAHCVATGNPFWGKRTQAGSVLYLDLESRDYRVQNRMEKTGLPGAQGIGFAFEAGRLDTDLMEQLSAYHEQHEDLRLVIVDPLARVKGAGKSRSDAYITDTMTLAPLQSWALGRGIAVLCVTHMRKQGFVRADSDPFEQITGSNAQFGVADGAWLITGAREDRERMFIASGRDYEGVELSIRFMQDTCRWRCLGDAQDQEREKYEASPVVKTIRALLSESGGAPVRVTANDLLTAVIQRYGMVGYTSVTLSKYLRGLEQDLLRYDGILYTAPIKPSKIGRLHEFSYTSSLSAHSAQSTVITVDTVDHARLS